MPEGNKPLFAVTMGDAAGTGPEIITMALSKPRVRKMCRAVVIGDATVMRDALRITGEPGKIRAIQDLENAQHEDGIIEVLDLKNIDLENLTRGRVSTMAGKAAYEYVKLATELTLQGKTDAVVTSAINKEALNKAGYHYDGHTELLSELCEVSDVAMMLVAEKLRTIMVSTHVSLREALERVRPQRIIKVIKLAHNGIEELGVKDPHLAVAGLNPHAGEEGLFGDEEPKYIVPAIEEARKQGMTVSGPYPPDTVYFRAHQGEFDGVVAMYHDQGHIPVKMLGIWLGVNITLGLPIVRTSVDHGTSFDKAGQGTADPRSLIEAMQLARRMVENRKRA